MKMGKNIENSTKVELWEKRLRRRNLLFFLLFCSCALS